MFRLVEILSLDRIQLRLEFESWHLLPPFDFHLSTWAGASARVAEANGGRGLRGVVGHP